MTYTPNLPSVDVNHLLTSHRPGYSLARPFYTDPTIFEFEYKHLISRQWQYAGQIQTIPNQGDFFLFQIAGEEIIIIRGDDDTVYAHYNVCRHRGSRVCLEDSGNAKRLTCPYHAWSYRIDGTLAAARMMPDHFDKSQFPLKSCQVRLFEGMIFVNLSPEGTANLPDFDVMADQLRPWVGRANLRHTKIVMHEEYPSAVNWKIALENYFECYHCLVSHPEWSNVQAHTKRDAVGTPKAREQFREINRQWKAKAREMGHETGGMQHGVGLPADQNYQSQMSYAERMVTSENAEAAYTQMVPELAFGQNGRPLGSRKLLGAYAADDGGQLDWGILPSAFLYTSCTSSVIMRITPLGPLQTAMSQTWLVHEDAVEGVDYDLESLLWLDRVTMAQDEKIVRDTQSGVSSRVYEPGPYAKLEGEILGVHNDYIRLLKHGLELEQHV